jgi:hypothetical protein
MAVNYQMDNRDTRGVHQCPMCGEAYTETVDSGTPWFSRYTDNCDCHNRHETMDVSADALEGKL